MERPFRLSSTQRQYAIKRMVKKISRDVGVEPGIECQMTGNTLSLSRPLRSIAVPSCGRQLESFKFGDSLAAKAQVTWVTLPLHPTI